MPFGASNVNTVVANATLTAATEVVAAVSTAESLGTEYNTQGLRIRGKLNVSGVAGTTSYAVKCRQGANTITGAQVGSTETTSVSASESVTIPFDFVDTAPVAGNNVYSVTVTAAGANGTLNTVTIGVEVCDQYQGN